MRPCQGVGGGGGGGDPVLLVCRNIRMPHGGVLLYFMSLDVAVGF